MTRRWLGGSGPYRAVHGVVGGNHAYFKDQGERVLVISGDDPRTVSGVAEKVGVEGADRYVDATTLKTESEVERALACDSVFGRVKPEQKKQFVLALQKAGHTVAMTGDGTNDAPALAQADVAVAMNSGTQAAKEAGNMVDLDSSPTKLIDIVRIGKQLLMTRGSLTTFSIANDVAKYFAIIPALFMGLYPRLSALNIMGLHSPQSAVLSAIIYNALIIIALIPLALKGVKYREVAAGKLLSRNLLVYGLGGLAAPFIFVKLIDVLLVFTGLV